MNATQLGVTQIYAGPQLNQIVFSDDFSQGFSQWEMAQGSWDYWQIIDGQLQGQIFTSSTVTEMVPKDEFWPDGLTDFEIELDYFPTQGADRNLVWGYINSGDFSEIHFTGSIFNLVKYEPPWQTPINIFQSFSLANHRWYHFKIRLVGETLEVWKDNSKIAVSQDASWLKTHGGKLALRVTSGSVAPTQVLYDNIKVTALSPLQPQTPPAIQLDVEVQKQTDELWSSLEYDHASRWADDVGIGRWGCALTSLSMILNYHHINQLPSGEMLNPQTLNEWLLTQPDGYIAQGLVNWLAASRLSRIISQNSLGELPTLELEIETRQPQEKVVSDLQKERPSIIQIPGHFMVASGFDFAQNQLTIADPYYSFTSFDQHQQPMISSRHFIPSHTDLSYLVFVHQPQVSLSIVDEQEQSILPVIATEFIAADDLYQSSDYSQNQAMVIEYLPKPDQGKYKVEIFQADVNNVELQILAYNPEGEVIVQKINQPMGNQQTLEVNYFHDNLSILPVHENQLSFSPPSQTWQELEEIIDQLYKSEKIHKHYLYRLLKRVIRLAIGDQEHNYGPLFIDLVSENQEHFEPKSTLQIFQVLDQI